MHRPSDPITSLESSIVGALLSTFLFGFYLSIAFRCYSILWARYRQKQVHWYLLATHAVLFILVNIQCLSSWTRALVTVYRHQERKQFEGMPVWSGESLLVNTTWLLAIFISDAFITYRTYTVWNKQWYVVVFPLLLLAAHICVSIYLLVLTADKDTPDYLIVLNFVSKFIMTISLLCNLLNTALISHKLWSVQKHTSDLGLASSGLFNLAYVLAEAAAVYVLILIAHITLIALNSFMIYIFIDIETPIIGIVFSNIIVSQKSVEGGLLPLSKMSRSRNNSITWPPPPISQKVTGTATGYNDMLEMEEGRCKRSTIGCAEPGHLIEL